MMVLKKLENVRQIETSIDVIAFMERWARWSYGGGRCADSILSKIRQAKSELEITRRAYKAPCQWCKLGEVNGRTCHKCRGSGERLHVHLEVNPASIAGTKARGMNEDHDPISAAIDHLVASWLNSDASVWWNIVTILEYTSAGNLTQRAKSQSRGISQGFFSRKLSEAHKQVEMMLRERFYR